jgi:hypothetical protein
MFFISSKIYYFSLTKNQKTTRKIWDSNKNSEDSANPDSFRAFGAETESPYLPSNLLNIRQTMMTYITWLHKFMMQLKVK